MTEPKRTPLYEFHVLHGARFVGFSGWEMPVQYKSIIEEHKCVRSSAGLFDVSHMGEVTIKGQDACLFLNYLVTNDVASLTPGRVLYTPMCYPDGGVVDDLLVYKLEEESYLLCLNAGNVAKDIAWIEKQAEGRNCEIEDVSTDYGLLALQGPASIEILNKLASIDVATIEYYHFAYAVVAGVECLLSRTGYTGEIGFEIFCSADEITMIAEELFSAGEQKGLMMVGLGARDSLRLEAGFSLYGHEISEAVSPIEANLAWTVKFSKTSDFIGRKILCEQKEKGSTKRLLFFKTEDRRIVRAGSDVFVDDDRVGEVVSGTLSPVLNVAIGSMLVDSSAIGKVFYTEIRGQMNGLVLTKPPFVPLKS